MAGAGARDGENGDNCTGTTIKKIKIKTHCQKIREMKYCKYL